MADLLDAALGYSRRLYWDVVPGTYLVREGRGLVCSCGWNCGSPGTHPASPDWTAEATGDDATVTAWWTAAPRSSVLVPAGRRFDVIDVPEPAGCLALARLERAGIATGPVAATASRRVLFLVLPGGRDKIPTVLRRLGFSAYQLDLRYLSTGDYLLAPPSQELAGPVYWVRPPAEESWWLPSARQLLGEVAHSCRRASSALGRPLIPR